MNKDRLCRNIVKKYKNNDIPKEVISQFSSKIYGLNR